MILAKTESSFLVSEMSRQFARAGDTKNKINRAQEKKEKRTQSPT
jgi:hypothetical protein